ncbi:MAG: extracellular solute-binding protein [Alphaproteobacteria bacterium]|nr:extracellular solute-binding protein [Alphaproteobacteria bacterium]
MLGACSCECFAIRERPRSALEMSMSVRSRLLAFAAAIAALAVSACQPTPPKDGAQLPDAGVVNVYSARHYDADAEVFRAFTKATGVRVQTIEAQGDQLIERLKAEGDASPADVILTVDAGNLWRLKDQGLLKNVKSPTLDAAIPAPRCAIPTAPGTASPNARASSPTQKAASIRPRSRRTIRWPRPL